MKILFPCATYYPAQIGGPNNTLLWHSTYLTQHNLKPMIIASDYGIGSDIDLNRGEWFARPFGDIIYYREKNKSFPIKTIRSSLRNLKKVDIVHFNGMLNRVSLFSVFLVAIGNKPIVLSPRGELFGAAMNRKSLGKKFIVWLYSLIKKRVLFHATSIEEEQTIKKYFGEGKVVVQPNFIVAEYSDKVPNEKKDFLFLGRINPIKNIHILIEGASKSNAFMEGNARIIIAGKAWLDYEIKYLAELNALISKLGMQEKVVFEGHVENEDKEKLLSEAYFLVLPSKSENFGNVVLESLIKGTPVIASTGTPWQSLRDNDAGYWVESNIDALAGVIDKVLAMQESEYSELSNNAKKLVEAAYDIESPANKWIEIYKNMMK